MPLLEDESSSNDYIVRPMRPDDVHQIVFLLKKCLGLSRVPRTLDFWNWKHKENPFGRSAALVAEAAEGIIGLRVFARWIWHSSKSQIRSVRAVDTVTHPDWQKKGIFMRLTTTLLEDVHKDGTCFVFNTPNKVSMVGYLKLGWKVVTRLPVWIRPLHPFRASLRLLRNTDFASDIWSNSPPSIPENVLEQSLSAMDCDQRLHTARSPAYFKWRYSDIPGFQYHTRSKIEGDSAAAIVFRFRPRHGMQELSLSEILLSSDPVAVDLASQILSGILNESSADYAIAIAADGTPEQKVLKKLKFLKLNRLGPILVVKQLSESVQPDIFEWSNWRCSTGDLEIF